MRNGNLKCFSRLISSYSTFHGIQRQPASLLKKYKLASEVSNLSHPWKERKMDNCIHISFMQRNLLVLVSGWGAIIHPKRADFVANTNELLDGVSLKFLLFKMKAHPCGRELLRKRPRISQGTLDDAWLCEEHTFGEAYAQFMGTRSFSPRERPAIRFFVSSDLAYLALRMRESHDFWHVLFGCSTSVTSELHLKLIEFRYSNMPSAGLSYFLAPIRLGLHDRRSFYNLFFTRTHFPIDKDELIFSILEERLSVPLNSLRRELLFKVQ
jgi:ubiquinone biosynthesis protein COQ4|mmetsp:Transcript_1956/g.5940  ORF Transcript_1956/g.5940 Transcript_1956/m.5940 type:complete len:268 (-) Transcript_1956:2789-3592(-)